MNKDLLLYLVIGGVAVGAIYFLLKKNQIAAAQPSTLQTAEDAVGGFVSSYPGTTATIIGAIPIAQTLGFIP
jgi:hypothetical protein